MNIQQVGNEIIITGRKRQLKEFLRILRNTLIDHTISSKVVCRISSALNSDLDKLFKDKKGTANICFRRRIKDLDGNFDRIMEFKIPKSFKNMSTMVIGSKCDTRKNPKPLVVYTIKDSPVNEFDFYPLKEAKMADIDTKPAKARVALTKEGSESGSIAMNL